MGRVATLTLEGAERLIKMGNWSVRSNINGVSSMSAILEDATSAFRAGLLDESVLLLPLGNVDSTNTIALGPAGFTVPAGLVDVYIGARVRIASKADPTNYMSGYITHYVGATMTVDVDVAEGAGVYSDFEFGYAVFGGEVQEKTENDFGDVLNGITTNLAMRGFNTWAQNMYVNGVIFQGTVKHALEVLIDLAQFWGYDLTLDAAQVDGPILPDMTLPFVRFDDVFKQISVYSNFVIEIDPNKVVRAYAPGSLVAPFDVSPGTGTYFGDVSVTESHILAGRDYANRVVVIWGGTPATIRRIDIVSNTATNPTVIETATPHQLFSFATVTIQDNVGSNVDINDSDLPVTIIDDTHFSIAKNCTASGGTGGSFVRTDDISSPIFAQADDPAEQALHKVRYLVVTTAAISEAATAQATADAILLQRAVSARQVNYRTFRHGIRPGQFQLINVPKRNFTADCLITDVKIGAWEDKIIYDVTALEGSVLGGDWFDVYKQWSGGSTAVAGVTGSASTGGQQAIYPLGGSLSDFVRSATPTWVAATPARVVIDTVTRGSTSAVVKARLRAFTGTVQARLYNVTLGVSVGASTTVAAALDGGGRPIWGSATFPVTLTVGTYEYELQVLPSVANKDVAAWGYLV